MIDKISMIENHMLERLNLVMKDARKTEKPGNAKKPFGGVQMVVTGDFCQLPPVRPFEHCMQCGYDLLNKRSRKEYLCTNRGCNFEDTIKDSDRWAFRSRAWEECKFKHVGLKKVHRETDVRFISLLERCRFGQSLSDEEKSYLGGSDSTAKDKQLHDTGPDTPNQPVVPKLFPTKDDVAALNEKGLASINDECLEFCCLDDFKWNPIHEELSRYREPGFYPNTLKHLDDHSFVDRLEMKRSMPVILLVNLDSKAGLINGRLGKLVGWKEHRPEELPDIFGDYADIRKQLMRQFIDKAHWKKWPIVSFPGHPNCTIYPWCMLGEMGNVDYKAVPVERHSLLSRTQIPLAAAWAITIHKTQGMTLDRAEVDLSRAWEQAQRYAALSRVQTPEGLTVTNWGNCSSRLDPQVLEFLIEKGLWDDQTMKEEELEFSTPITQKAL